MEDFTINEMQDMQRKLQEKYKDKWEAIGPETGKNKLLWMVGEIGEVIDIIKKNGGTKACSDAKLRNDLVEKYIKESADQPFFAAYDSDKPIGFLCLKETGKETVELCVMGVLKDYHRKGVGRKLFERAKEEAKQAGYSFIFVCKNREKIVNNINV